MCFETSLHHEKRRGGWRGGGFVNTILASICVEKTGHDGLLSFMCFEKGLHGLKKRGDWGGRSPPPICKHNACVMGFDRIYA